MLTRFELAREIACAVAFLVLDSQVQGALDHDDLRRLLTTTVGECAPDVQASISGQLETIVANTIAVGVLMLMSRVCICGAVSRLMVSDGQLYLLSPGDKNKSGRLEFDEFSDMLQAPQNRCAERLRA